MSQLGLFGAGIEPVIEAHDVELAERLPRFVRFGTSSWSFPGWRGIVYRGEHTASELARAGLSAYARHPLLRTVSLDRAHYAPLRTEDLASYAAELAEAPNFRIVPKVWSALTNPEKPSFLDPDVFRSEVLAPYEATLASRLGPFVFQLAPVPRGTLDEAWLVRRLEAFLERAPTTFRYAFELRNAEVLGARWLDALRAHRAAHVFNYWTAMPPLRAQLRAGTHATDFLVMRLMLPPFSSYEARRAALAPFDRIVAPRSEMRDDVVHVLRAAEEAGCSNAFVLVNNKAEGSAPLTVRALAEALAR